MPSGSIETIKIVTYNIQFGRGRDGRLDLGRIAEAVAGADVVALQEVERYWARTNGQDQPAILGELLNEFEWIYGPAIDLRVAPNHAAASDKGRRRQFGNMILSKLPILSGRHFLLPKAAGVPGLSLQRGMLEAVVGDGLNALRVYCLHLCHLMPESRLPQVDAVVNVMRQIPAQGGVWSGTAGFGWDGNETEPPMPESWVMAGDFNFSPASEEYGRLTGSDIAPVDSWVAAGRDPAVDLTFLSMDGSRSARLDHIFVSTDLERSVVDIRVDHEALGSDHYPVWIELTVPASISGKVAP